jgi:hypothetical protein
MGMTSELEIISHSGNVCTIKDKNIVKPYWIREKGGNTIIPTVPDENTIQFETTPGGIYTIDYTVGIKPVPEKNKTVEIYPNPAKAGDKITVHVNRDSKLNYSIINTSGEILKEGILKTGKNELILPAQKGVFILSDNTGNRRKWSKIIIN